MSCSSIVSDPKSRKYFGKIRTAFEGIASQPHRLWQSAESSKECEQRILRQHSIPFTERIRLAYGLPKETITAIMILYRNTKVMVRSFDRDRDFFDIVTYI